MYSFRPDYLSRLNLPGSTAWLVGACMEAKGKQDLWLRQKPEVLEALKELAIISSSNRPVLPGGHQVPMPLGQRAVN